MTRTSPPSWVIVLPVKHGYAAKSRLRAPAGVDHARLARAFAIDTLAAAAGTGEAVVVVTSDPIVSDEGRQLRASVVPDRGEGLNAAIRAGLSAAVSSWPARGVAVLASDLPAARPQDLRTALGQADRHARAVVPDHTGRGTVLLTGRPGVPLTPRFGPDSAARHRREGHVPLDLALPRLRTDVDDLADLEAVRRLGVGTATRAALDDPVEHATTG